MDLGYPKQACFAFAVPGALVRVCCAGPPGLSPLIVDSRRVPFRPGMQFHIHADLVAESVLIRTLVA